MSSPVVIGVVSAKGSPGATTAALAFAAGTTQRGLLVELDPSGGSVECWTGMTGEPGLVQAANALRRSTDPEAVTGHAVQAPPGVWSVLAPSSGTMAESTITSTGDRLVAACSQLDREVVVDGGRWARTQPTAHRMAGCDVIAVVCAPTVAGVEAARGLAEPLASTTGSPLVLVLVGDRPYTPAEVATAVAVPVAGVLPWDRRAVGVLLTAGAGRGWSRTPLARSARSILETLQSFATDGARSDV